MATSFFNNNCEDEVEELESAKQYADLSRDWAIKMDGLVDGIDFSSKYWALQSAEGAGLSVTIKEDGTPLGDDFTVLNFGAGVSATQTTTNEVLIQSTGQVLVETFDEGVGFIAGTSDEITLATDVVSKNNIDIYFDGVYQNKETYDVSGILVTFTSIIPIGVSEIEVVYPRLMDVGVTSADNVTFDGSTVDAELVSLDGRLTIVERSTLVNRPFPNVAAVDTATFLQTGDFVEWLGYYTPGDGGGNKGEIGIGFGTADNGSVFDLSGSGLQARGLFSDKTFRIKQFGAVIDGITDDYTAINSAINYLYSLGGGDLYLGVGKIAVGTTVEVIESSVKLIGQGHSFYSATSGRDLDPATEFVWIGSVGGTVIDLHSPDNVSEYKRTDIAAIDFGIDGAGVAAVGLKFRSINGGHLKITSKGCTSRQIEISTVEALADARDPQFNNFEYMRVVAEDSADGVYMDSTIGANVSLNNFSYIYAQHENGNGVVFGNTDNNTVSMITTARIPGGTGIGVVFSAADGITKFHARSNLCFRVSTGIGGIVCQGTETNTIASENNYIQQIDRLNGTPDPTIGTGASIYWGSNVGVFQFGAANKMVAADTHFDAVTQKSLAGTETLRVFNASQNHIRVISDTGTEFSLDIDASGPRLRLVAGDDFFRFIGFDVRMNQAFSLTGIPTFADNAAALGGGLINGDVYKTSTGELRITFGS